MSLSVTIPKEEYENLIGFKRIVEMEYGRSISKVVLKELERARKDIKSGKGSVFHSREEIKRYFDAM